MSTWSKRRARIAAVLFAFLALFTGASLAGSSAVASTSVTGVTWLPGNLDNGNGSANNGGWAIDAFHRTLTVTADPTKCAVVTGFTCYVASVSDSGTFTTLPGNGRAPNPDSTTDPGTNIAWPAVSGPFSGSADYVFLADKVPAVSDIPDVVDNHGAYPVTRPDTTSDWFVNAFPSTTVFDNSSGHLVTLGGPNDTVLQNDWTWSYTSQTGASATTTAVSCESWTDSYVNGGGNTAADGNITGKQCAGTPITSPDVTYTGPVVLRSNGQCLDDRLGGGVGSPVQIWRCNGNDNQQWTVDYTNGEVMHGGLCLTAPATTRGAKLVLGNCNASSVNDLWYTSHWHFTNHSGLVMDDTAWGGSGTQQELWENNGGANQFWRTF